jgi:16S rRNA processing protein RimM
MAGARICLGQIGAPHGLRGEVRLRSFTSDPQAVAGYGPLETDDGRIFSIELLRPVKDHFVARLSGVRDRDAAERLANVKLYVPRERLPELVEVDEFYHADLVGLAVVDRGGQRLGTVVAIHNFGAGDLIEVRADDGDTALVPFDEINVPQIEMAAGRIVVDLPQQLFKARADGS